MDMNTGIVHDLSDEETLKKLQNNQIPIGADGMGNNQMMKMNNEQVKAVQGMPNRKARRYMLKQPCTCGSGKQARKCCF